MLKGVGFEQRHVAGENQNRVHCFAAAAESDTDRIARAELGFLDNAHSR